jgi:hypothetical protein
MQAPRHISSNKPFLCVSYTLRISMVLDRMLGWAALGLILALACSGAIRQLYTNNETTVVVPVSQRASSINEECVAAAALARVLPTTLSNEATAFLAARADAPRSPPISALPQAEGAAFTRGILAAFCGPSAERHREALVASDSETTIAGVPVVRSTPKLGVALDGTPSAAGPTAMDETAVILYIHGGAYIAGSALGMAHTYAPLSAATGGA